MKEAEKVSRNCRRNLSFSASAWFEMRWFFVLFLVAVLDALNVDVSCVRLDDIYWNSTNPIFRIDNTDHIIDVNKNNIPFEYDQVNIICPVYSTSTKEEEVEKYIIYNVSKEEYDACTITNPQPRIIARCERPHTLLYVTITFRSFTPQPGGLEFRPGQDYYFISTSSRENLDSKHGGRCLSHNMRIIFKVCCDPSKVTPTTRVHFPSTTTALTTWTTPTTPRRRVITTTTSRTTSRVLWPKTTMSIKNEKQPENKQNKKKDRKDDQSNETQVKNEELVNAGVNLDTKNILLTNLLIFVAVLLAR